MTTRRQATTDALELGRTLGQSPDVRIHASESPERLPPVATLDADSLVQAALAGRPDLAARVAEERQAESLTHLARRAAIPNLRLGAVLTRDRETGTTSWGFGVGLPIPLWNRNQGFVATGEALTRRASLTRSATELRVRTEVEQAARAYAAASEEARIFEVDVLAPARQNQDLLETAYRAGRIDLTDLVLLRNQLLDAELGYWDAWLTLRTAWIDLQSATGSLREAAPAPENEE
jgi:cobalt-zinc-cadmium efflux system outer membrane protein